MTTGKSIALTRWTFVGKVISLLFNMLSRLVIAFLPRREHLLISWLQSPSAVIFGAPQNKVCHCFHCFPIYLPWSDGNQMPWYLFSECWALRQLFHSLSLSSFEAQQPIICSEGAAFRARLLSILWWLIPFDLCVPMNTAHRGVLKWERLASIRLCYSFFSHLYSLAGLPVLAWNIRDIDYLFAYHD